MKAAFHTEKIRGASVDDLRSAYLSGAFGDGGVERVGFIRDKLVEATLSLAEAARTFQLLAAQVEETAKHRETYAAALYEAMEDKQALDAAPKKPAPKAPARRARGKRGAK